MSSCIGFGLSLSFSTFSATIQGTVEGPGLSQDALENSHMGLATSDRTFCIGFRDSGEVTFELQFDPDEPDPRSLGQNVLTITMPLPDGQAVQGTWAASAICTEYSPSIPLDDLITASVTFKLSGAITIVAST